ncbi:MAG: hypothetical protein B7733_06195 [Myxococcales bacterium FL481]|nr:MAG: hypothetical protein B7733_06195 [Myxococcales bacterium FL481]
MPFTNEGFRLLEEIALRGEYDGGAVPTEFFLAVASTAVVPDEDTVLFSELTEISSAFGYQAGGYSIPRSAVGFPTNTVDSPNSRAYTQGQTVSIACSGGDVTDVGYAVLLGPHATPGSRKVIKWKAFPSAPVTFSDGDTIELQKFELSLRQPT